MDTHRSVKISRWIYARLLRLYPAGHRAEYGADMLQLFTDQCRAAAREKAPLTFLLLWLRTLADLSVSALREHITTPHTWPGLLEAVPNAPLPWGGVVLVLLPGLVFFIAQVAQLTGLDWFFLLTYRAGYVMIVPVLLVWLWKRKFPIWGLIPLGVFLRTALDFGFRMTLRFMVASNPFNAWWLKLVEEDTALNLRIAVFTLMLLTVLTLLWLVNRLGRPLERRSGRRSGISAAAWAGLAAFLLLAAFLAYRNVSSLWEWMANQPAGDLEKQIALGLVNPGPDVFDAIYYIVYNYLGLLILILLGALLARRHGRLATLLPLGYLLPAVVYGRVSDNWPSLGDSEFTFMLAVSAAALAFRFLVALAGPLWIVRSASGELQKRASAISLLTLVGIQAGFNLVVLFTGMQGPDLMPIAWGMIARELILAAAMFLALNLYRSAPSTDLLPLPQREEAQAEKLPIVKEQDQSQI